MEILIVGPSSLSFSSSTHTKRKKKKESSGTLVTVYFA
jgi:hypothetical protein